MGAGFRTGGCALEAVPRIVWECVQFRLHLSELLRLRSQFVSGWLIRCDLWNECGEKAGELLLNATAGFHDVFVVDGFGGFMSVGRDSGGHVGDEG